MMDGVKDLGATDFSIANPEREFTFLLDDVKYKVVLSCPRSWARVGRPPGQKFFQKGIDKSNPMWYNTDNNKGDDWNEENY